MTLTSVQLNLVYPRDLFHPLQPDTILLGLGDIALPGMFLSFLLRYDYYQACQRAIANFETKIPNPRDSFLKLYFHAGILAYLLGLAV